jgi:hypothetical protein
VTEEKLVRLSRHVGYDRKSVSLKRSHGREVPTERPSVVGKSPRPQKISLRKLDMSKVSELSDATTLATRKSRFGTSEHYLPSCQLVECFGENLGDGEVES